MAPTLLTVAVFATLSMAGGLNIPSFKEIVGDIDQGLRGARQLYGPVYCSTLQCPDRTTLIADAGTTECHGDVCEPAQCCVAYCSYHQCTEATTLVDDANTVSCPDLECTDDLCCEALCSSYQCPDGDIPVDGASEIACPDLACTDGLCCDMVGGSYSYEYSYDGSYAF